MYLKVQPKNKILSLITHTLVVRLLCQQHHMHTWYCREDALENDKENNKLLNKVILVFFAHKMS